MADATLTVGDYIIVAIYFAMILGAGLYSMYRTNRSTVSGYFLAGRFMVWFPIGASLFASNIGSEHFIGLAGSGAAAGIAVGAFELNACIILQLLGWVFLPVYIASKVCTLPEYMSTRFGGKRIQIYLASLSVILYVFTKISVNLYSGALFIQQAVHMNLYVSVIVLLFFTALTTVTGGLAAVIYTETLQTSVVITGSTVLAIISYIKVGGYENLYNHYMTAIPNTTLQNPNTTCGYPRSDSWYMLRNPVDSDMPWIGFIFGQSMVSVWYWCADQIIVQRALAAKDISHAQGATLFAGFLKLLPPFLIVIPGMISRILFADRVACADPDVCERVCQSRISCTNLAYPILVLELLPTGLRGLLISVMLAAQMSEMSSIFNSSSTLFTMDIYSYIRKQATIRELMIVGRLFVCVMIGISILWIPVVQAMQGGQLYIYIQAVSAYLAPPIATVYLMAVLWEGANEMGAFSGLMTGTAIGLLRMILDFTYPSPPCDSPDNRPLIIARVHYMYFAMILTAITFLTTLIISKFTGKQEVTGLTFWTRHRQTINESEDIEGATNISDDSEMAVIQSTENMVDATRQSYTEQTELVEVSKLSEHSAWNLKKILRWFCGLEGANFFSKTEEMQSKRINSLEQTQFQRYILLSTLVILIFLNIFLYIFFSTGSNFGLF